MPKYDCEYIGRRLEPSEVVVENLDRSKAWRICLSTVPPLGKFVNVCIGCCTEDCIKYKPTGIVRDADGIPVE